MQPHLIRQLDDAVAEVFALMLNLACTSEVKAAAQICNLPLESGLTAFAQFSGTMEGLCAVQLNQCAAIEIAANLMGIPTDEVAFDICADTAGELCNMIAGAWKSLQPGLRAACKLSCPEVAVGALHAPVLGFAEAATVCYYFAGQRLTVHLTCN
jgi:chemotaxis protein CheX